MTDEWTFPTTTGRATVADGRLRISGSLRRSLREKWREGWTRNGRARRLLFLVSVVSSAGFLARVVPSARAALAGRADTVSWFVLAVAGLLAVAVVYRTTRTKTARLRDVSVVKRVDDDRFRVERAGDRDAIEFETPTERDADDAVEILRLRSVTVEDATDAETPASAGFRRRLRAKERS